MRTSQLAQATELLFINHIAKYLMVSGMHSLLFYDLPILMRIKAIGYLDGYDGKR